MNYAVLGRTPYGAVRCHVELAVDFFAVIVLAALRGKRDCQQHQQREKQGAEKGWGFHG